MNAVIQNFHLPLGTLISYDGFQVVVVGSCRDGTIVRDRWVGDEEAARHFVIPFADLQALQQRLDVEIITDIATDVPAVVQLVKKNRWVEASAEQQDTALRKAAWCEAARSVLRSEPLTETQISRHFREIQAVAFERQKLLRPRGARRGSFEVKEWGPRSVANFCKVYFSAGPASPALLLDRPRSGNRSQRLTSAESALLDKCCEAYLSKAQPNGASIVRLVRKRFTKANAESAAEGGLLQLRIPHFNTVYRRLAAFSKLERTFAREGRKEAQKKFSPTQHGIRALKPGELIEIDFWQGDLFTLSKASGFWDLLSPDLQAVLKDGTLTSTQRPAIGVAVDSVSRMVLAVCMATSPKARSSVELIDMIMRDKSELSERAGCKMVWTQHCGIGTIVADTGGEFYNAEFQTAVLAAGGSFTYGRAGVPMDKPLIERFFGGLRSMFVDDLPGKTGYSPDCLIDYDSEGMAVFDMDQFRQLLVRYLVDVYPLLPHAGLQNARPIDAWNRAQEYGVVIPPQPRVRRNATGLKLKRLLTKEGITISGIPFSAPSLFPDHIRNGNVEVEVRVDPNDLREVTILLEGRQVHLANQRPSLAGYSLRTMMAAVKAMTSAQPADQRFYEHVLARHAEWFEERIRRGVEQHGLPSTEISEAELDRFEKSYVLRLQVEAAPEFEASADLYALFKGGSGLGIFGAGDIAVEQAGYRKPENADKDEPDAETAKAHPKARRLAKTPKIAPPADYTGAPVGKGKLK